MIITLANRSPVGGNGVLASSCSFDGSKFKPNPVDPSTLWLDYGHNLDGALGWENFPVTDGRRTLAFIMNSYDANALTNTWKWMMSFPRGITLKEQATERYFLQQHDTEITLACFPLATIQNQTINTGQMSLSSLHGITLMLILPYH